MAFDPTQPFQIIPENQPVKNGFDPTQPFEVVEQDTSTGFIENVTSDLKKRGEDFGKELNRIVTGDVFGSLKGELPTPIKRQAQLLKVGSRVAGAVAGSAMDIIGEGINSGVDVIEDMLPGTTNAIKKTFTASLDSILNQLPGGAEALKKGVEQTGVDAGELISKFAETNPEISRDLEDLGNVAILAIGPKSKSKSKGNSILSSTAKGIDKLAKGQRQNYLLGLAKGPDTRQQVKNNIVTPITQETKYVPTKADIKVADTLAEVKKISPAKSFQFNHNQVANHINKLGSEMESVLKKEKIAEVNSLNNAVRETIDVTQTHSSMVGQEALATRELTKIKRILSKFPKNTWGTHKARVEYDKLTRPLLSKYKEKGTPPTPIDIVYDTIRTSLNSTVDAKHGNIISGYRERLASLYAAKDVIEFKAFNELNTVSERVATTLAGIAPKAVPFGNAALSGINQTLNIVKKRTQTRIQPAYVTGSLSNVRTLATSLTLPPSSKRAIANLIKGIDKALKVTKSKEIISQLKLDRIALIEMAKTN